MQTKQENFFGVIRVEGYLFIGGSDHGGYAGNDLLQYGGYSGFLRSGCR